MQKIGESIATSTTPVIGRCISFDRQNTNRVTYRAIPTTSTIIRITGTTITSVITVMDTMTAITMTRIDINGLSSKSAVNDDSRKSAWTLRPFEY
jgi:hypothetical protein